MKVQLFLLAALSAFLFACSSPEAIQTAVQATVAARPPVIEMVEQTVIAEVPVTVEVTRVVEVEREVEVTREVEVEVTRIVEQVVTATPSPTPEPTSTPTPRPTQQAASAPPPTAPPADLTSTLLASMQATKRDMEIFGGMIDTALRVGFISCLEVTQVYDRVNASPTYDVAASSALVQGAYGGYRAAIDLFANGTRDMYLNCSDGSSGSIPFQQWGLARQTVNDALNVLNPAIQSLE